MKTITLNLTKTWYKFHGKRIEWIKLKFIGWWHRINGSKYCWADCVAWAFSPSRFNPFNIETGEGCKVESKTHFQKACYCGQWINGNHVSYSKLKIKN